MTHVLSGRLPGVDPSQTDFVDSTLQQSAQRPQQAAELAPSVPALHAFVGECQVTPQVQAVMKGFSITDLR